MPADRPKRECAEAIVEVTVPDHVWEWAQRKWGVEDPTEHIVAMFRDQVMLFDYDDELEQVPEEFFAIKAIVAANPRPRRFWRRH
jgi:hypothetical protein